MSLACPTDPWFPRSTLFLLPLVLKDRGSSLTSLQTHLALDGMYSFNDCRLLISGAGKVGSLFFVFNEDVLTSHPYYEKNFLTENNKRIYVFNLSSHREDLRHFLNGDYHKFSAALMQRLSEFYQGDSELKGYLSGFLSPETKEAHEQAPISLEDDLGGSWSGALVGKPGGRYDVEGIETFRIHKPIS